ncbi:hypothetical protein FJT64_004119 [Amphibalanus amphitrite]|uniref:SEA domain-containing protein n=1 Tax=Amphibalanus amphitrite TaxID=1232801 RepID=A0A6A4W011_AMPAM|nr:hypothetical protein FJT64_004119 [Amphibalanus amphitrite]
MTTVSTTTQPTTTEAPPPVSAKLSCMVRITSISYQDWMALPFTNQYSDLANAVEQVSQPVLVDKFGDDFRSVAVTGFRSGSVLVDMEVVVMTDKTRAEDVDAKTLSEETTVALQNLMEEGDFIFDPSAVETSEEIEVIEPTTSPAPTEDPYRHTIMRFEMRAPFANWTDDLNDTDSEAFANMEQEVQAGVELMLSKKYPKGEWNVSSYILWMSNATEDVEDDTTEPQGVKINFVVTVEPQMTNTSKIVQELARSFVFFNKLGTLQIAPDSVYFKGESRQLGDLTTYAPGMGVVIMDADYLRALRKTQYNGSFVGDFTTQPPTLQPVIKRHKGFVLGIAVPAFIGMIAAIGLLLICTTIAGAKKSDD